MQVHVVLFAMLREKKGASELDVEVPEGTTVEALETQIFPDDTAGAISGSLLYAVNRVYVSRDCILEEGDEVAFIPPVSGG